MKTNKLRGGFLLFFALVLSLAKGYSQNVNDTIQYEKVFGGYKYYYQGERIKTQKMMKSLITKETNPEAYKKWSNAKNLNLVGTEFAIIGAAELGTLAGYKIQGRDTHWQVTAFCAGLVAAGFGLQVAAIKKQHKAVLLYNESVESPVKEPEVSLDFGFTSDGIGFALRF